MARLSPVRIAAYFSRGDSATTRIEQGRALEDLICYVFEKIPGIEVTKRNELNAFETEEIDIAFWNNRQGNGLHFLPNLILTECKNWSSPVGTSEVSYFTERLRRRGRDFGILFAAQGITGSRTDLTNAHSIVASALSEGIQVVIFTRAEIETLNDTEQIITMLKEKLCELAVSGTIFSN